MAHLRALYHCIERLKGYSNMGMAEPRLQMGRHQAPTSTRAHVCFICKGAGCKSHMGSMRIITGTTVLEGAATGSLGELQRNTTAREGGWKGVDDAG